jgi:hypothetical protein
MAGAGEPCESLLPKRAPSSTASPLPMYKYPHSSFLLLKNFFLFHLPISFIFPSISSPISSTTLLPSSLPSSAWVS